MTKEEVVVRFDWHRVRTASGSDRTRKSQLVFEDPPDPVATARGSDTNRRLANGPQGCLGVDLNHKKYSRRAIS